MRSEYQILAAVALDLALGDPRWLPHPVRGIGWLAGRMEALMYPAHSVCRCFRRHTECAGYIAAMAVYLLVGFAAWAAIRLATQAHPLAGDLIGILIIYTAIAPRDLMRHSMAVHHAILAGDLPEARRRVAMIVGRDTQSLDEPEIVRAAVESVAESTVDGVTAPLLFAVVAGPIGAIVYRAINTLDSMFGHKDARYLHFGYTAAKIDDLANYLPARLTAVLICAAAALLRHQPRLACKTLLRDGRKHDSPNAGLSEAAMAGALGVQLGGTNYYDGQPLEKPTIGQAREPLSARHIPAANRLMLVTAGLVLLAALPLRALIVHLWPWWRTLA